MSKLYRSLLWSGLVAAGVAACGDDVTVVGPAKVVHSVTVVPDGATISVGGTVTLTAAVNADSGLATTVTWKSSDVAKATVDANGKVTGVAAGSVGITACSTANTAVCGGATVTVTAGPTVTISIQSITTGATFIPVNVNNVAGQIDVSLNLDPGTQGVSEVDVLIDNVVAAKQTFATAVRADTSKANAAVILLSVNTADFNPATGATSYKNGARVLTAKVVLANGSQKATQGTNLYFNNANTFVATPTYTGTTASATGTSGASTGLAFKRGGVTWGVLPVIYTTGQTLAVGSTLSFGGCDVTFGTRTLPLAAPATGSSTWTAAFPQTETGGAAATNVQDYEFDSTGGCAAFLPNGEGVTVTGVDNLGNAITFAPLPPPNVPVLIRLDNQAPGAPTFVANPNGRQSGWINGAVTIGNNSGATSNAWLANGSADQGIGGGVVTATSYLRFIRVDASGTTGSTVTAARGATAASTLTTPAPSAGFNSYCAVISARDELGNESALPASGSACTGPPIASFTAVAAQSLRFGVDIAPPTIAFSGGLGSNARINTATVAAEFQVTVADTGLVGNSGMLAGAPVIGTVQIRNAALTPPSAASCFIGVFAGGACGNGTAGFSYAGLPLVPTTTVAGSGTVGYYSYSSLAQDAAGNQTAPVSRVVVRDNVPVTATAPAVPVTITGAFTASSFLNDDLSIRDYFWTAGYTTALITPATITLASAPTAVDAYNSATLTNTNFAVNTSVNTFLGLQDGTGAAPAAYAAGSNPLGSVNLFARDQTQAAYTGPATSPVAPTAPASGITVAVGGATPWTFNTYTPATSHAVVCAGTLTGGCGAGTFTSTVLSVAASGTTATFPNVFSRIDFYAADAAGANLVLVGSVPAASATLVDNGSTRVYTYSLTVAASSLYSTLGGVSPAVVGPVNVYAFGVNAAGNVALVSAAVVETINP